MSQPYGYTDYTQPRGSRPSLGGVTNQMGVHESRESPDMEMREDDEGNEEGADPLTLAVLRLLMERGGR